MDKFLLGVVKFRKLVQPSLLPSLKKLALKAQVGKALEGSPGGKAKGGWGDLLGFLLMTISCYQNLNFNYFVYSPGSF